MRSIPERATSSPPTTPGSPRPGPPRDGDRLRLDGAPVRLKVNRRARRVSIRIDARAGEAVLTAPSERHLPEALAFARTRGAWIARHLADRPAATPLAPGAAVPFRGTHTPLEATGGADAARLVMTPQGPVIRAGGQNEAFARRVLRLLREEARRDLTARTDHHLATLGLKPVRLSIGDPRSRWGSCSPRTRSIRYSWRVVMAPPEVLDYLAAHEVAHLVHADHSPAYWAVVARLVGDHRPHRRWLREHGGALHAVGG